MTPGVVSYDAIVIGAGPAGCAAARLLAAWTHRVLLVDRPGGQSRLLAESIPPSTQKVLAAIGALQAIEDAGFTPWRGNTVWWGDDSPRVETFPPGAAGYQVDRARFDALLRRLAEQSGADVRTGLVRDVRLAGDSDAGEPAQPSITIDAAGETTQASAPFILDCSGRTGIIARRGLRHADSPARTVALAGRWTDERGFGVDLTHTLVASYADGWAWSVATSASMRHVTVMVDPERTDLARGESALEVYRAEVAKVRAFADLIAAARLTDGPWGADASPYTAAEYAGRDFLLVGDAGSFIDPLSSFGMKKALASAWLAAIATHTALTSPAMRDEAFGFFNRRERELAASAMKPSARFAADAAAGTAHPFWLARAAEIKDDELDDTPDPAELARDPDVLAAFEDLRRRPEVRLSRGRALRVAPRAAVRGRDIVMDDHVFLPGWPGGLRYLRSVDLVGLTNLAPHHRDVGDLYAAFVQAHREVALPDFLGALSVLIARGALVHER
ncbi:MAG TPA: tryptophan 7-halogenase [Vicinamibacterales bacterium]|nr:tryptophan 7-halogenase [Vicinamibacterales bacterium]